ncbi:hypothetical protein [Porphyromonas sp.]|uniref:hypothetical protein n=1 Tax=Porphyromonas sp. TaxID=1924944 RepID=UPI0026DB33FF|nr:hypothetical protein [Porphyromonas sp.]MDO4695709.1 hypothetical protein [Porphyromonas sp.]MDO4771111.1 hypothetical protein [Porphyromonas sp.]
MTKQFKLFIIATLLIFTSNVANAHTMWLETTTKAELGKEHSVSLYFGEFSMADRTPLKGWLAGMDQGTWEVLTPSGKVIKLTPKSADPCYTASFIPNEEGWYRIHYDCWVPQLWHGSKLHYQSIAWVHVGTSEAGLTHQSPFDQGITFLPPIQVPLRVGGETKFPVATEDGNYKGIKVNILGDNGWSKNYYRFPEGLLSFTPLWPGHYLINSTKTRELSEGEIKKFPDAKGVYDMITYFVKV